MAEQLALNVFSSGGVDLLRDKIGEEWPSITAARARSRGLLDAMDTRLSLLVPPDTTLVFFGSLARLEFTARSDIDWTLLVDGSAEADHRDFADRIEGRLGELNLREPNPGGAFGQLTFSHDLIHRIGGDDDSNRNTTQRLLLLLESAHIGDSASYDRVVRQVLMRYVEEDLVGPGDTPYGVPRFLLNDVVRYWRTMAVDFAQKRRVRRSKGWALRTAKLRMSRKLMYASGLMSCYSCDFLLPPQPTPSPFANTKRVVDHLSSLVRATPLDIIAWVVHSYEDLYGPGAQLFTAYDGFLALLHDEEQRKRLEELTPAEASDDTVYRTARELGTRFEEALTNIFFTCRTPVRDLTLRYGLF